MTVTRDHPRPRLGLHVVYDRHDLGFASMARDGVEFMLEVHGAGPGPALEAPPRHA